MHRRAARRRRTHGADSGHSWVAGEGSGVEGAADARRSPLISLDSVPQRAIRCPQKAEQLVEVPTEPGSSLAVIAVRALGRRAATALVEQIVDIAARGGLQGFLPGQGSSSRRFFQDEDEGFQGVFHTFPQPKKSPKVTRQSSPRVPASASSCELSAHQMAPAGESDELADEPGGTPDAAFADLQRWRRGLRRRGRLRRRWRCCPD